MPRKSKTDVLDMLSHFQKDVLKNKPSLEEMAEEIRMMRFKVRSLAGDISVVNLNNKGFIEALWSLGKLDEFFQNHIERLSPAKKQVFFPILDEMYQKFQKELNKVNIKAEKDTELANGFEMEIYKERSRKAN